MAKKFLGDLLAEARKAKRLTQEDVAQSIGMSRGNYGHMESGRRRDVLDPDQARTVSRRLGISMLDLVVAMGYPVECPGFEDEKEVALLAAVRKASPAERRFLLRGLGIED